MLQPFSKPPNITFNNENHDESLSVFMFHSKLFDKVKYYFPLYYLSYDSIKYKTLDNYFKVKSDDTIFVILTEEALKTKRGIDPYVFLFKIPLFGFQIYIKYGSILWMSNGETTVPVLKKEKLNIYNTYLKYVMVKRKVDIGKLNMTDKIVDVTRSSTTDIRRIPTEPLQEPMVTRIKNDLFNYIKSLIEMNDIPKLVQTELEKDRTKKNKEFEQFLNDSNSTIKNILDEVNNNSIQLFHQYIDEKMIELQDNQKKKFNGYNNRMKQFVRIKEELQKEVKDVKVSLRSVRNLEITINSFREKNDVLTKTVDELINNLDSRKSISSSSIRLPVNSEQQKIIFINQHLAKSIAEKATLKNNNIFSVADVINYNIGNEVKLSILTSFQNKVLNDQKKIILDYVLHNDVIDLNTISLAQSLSVSLKNNEEILKQVEILLLVDEDVQRIAIQSVLVERIDKLNTAKIIKYVSSSSNLINKEIIFNKKKTYGVSLTYKLYMQSLSIMLTKKIQFFFDSSKLRKNNTKRNTHTVMLMGRSGTGKTFFWEQFIEYWMSNKEFFSTEIDHIKAFKGIRIKSISTEGIYPSRADGMLKYKTIKKIFTVFDKELHDNITTIEYKKFQYSKKRTDIEIEGKQEQYGENMIKENGKIIKDKVEEISNLKDQNNVKNILLDNRMEVIRYVSLKPGKKNTGHFSTRNHIKKHIVFSKGRGNNEIKFNIVFFIWAGSEKTPKQKLQYTTEKKKKIIEKEGIHFTKGNEDLLNFLKHPTNGLRKFLSSQPNVAMKTNFMTKGGDLSNMDINIIEYKKHLGGGKNATKILNNSHTLKFQKYLQTYTFVFTVYPGKKHKNKEIVKQYEVDTIEKMITSELVLQRSGIVPWRTNQNIIKSNINGLRIKEISKEEDILSFIITILRNR